MRKQPSKMTVIKRIKNRHNLLFLFFLIGFYLNAQQIHVNREWRDTIGQPVFNPTLTPYGSDWTKSIVTLSTEIVTVGHTAVSGQGENILISKRSEDGVLIWQANYNSGSTFNDYGIDVIEDASGYIYVCGTTDNGGTTNYDIIVLVYDSNGSLQYSTSFDGPDGLNDIASCIKLDSYNNVIVGGTSESSTTGYDYLLVNYDPSLSFQWKANYDYNSLYDFAVGIEVEGGTVRLAGSSASSSTDWDYAVAEFDETTGSYISDRRDNLPGVGYDQVFAFTKDAVGNTYITGKASSNGTNYDIRTVMLSPSNTTVWAQSYDAFGLEDVGSSIVADPYTGDVIVGGYITKSNNVKDYIVLRYSSTGTLLWSQTQTSKDITSDAFIKKLCLNTTGEVFFIGGEKALGGNKQAIVGKIDVNGNKKWERAIKGNCDYLPSDIQYNGYGAPGIYAITVKDSAVNSYELSYFTEFKRDTTNVYASNGNPMFKKSEIIIRFNKNNVIPLKVNNTEITYGTLDEFIDSTGISSLNDYLRTEVGEYKVFKVFPSLTIKDSLSLSRSGQTVKVPPFYATFGVIFPTGINDTSQVKELRNAEGVIETADINYYFELANSQEALSCVPKAEDAQAISTLNDPDYVNGNSAGLDATVTYSNADINVTPAWSINTGDPSIIVGVYDSGINKNHQDFIASSIPNSKITTGYDYYNNTSIHNVTPYDRLGHGTGIAGIIGGIRNNGIAVSGIAGGDAALNQTGVTLHDMKLFEGNTINANCANISYGVTMDATARSIVDGALGSATANIGLAQHIQNFSWSAPSNYPLIQSEMQLLKDAIRNSFANEVLMSFAAGNNENPSFNSGIYNQATSYKDNWCLAVGANNENNLRANFSNGSRYLDFVAPGTTSLYNLLHKSSVTTTTDNLVYGSSLTCTANASGTSFSNPHAVGLAALMMSHVNTHPQKLNNIAPEDIEQLIEKNITDITTYSVGPDPQTGHGRINAGATMAKIKIPDYYVQHVNVVTTMSNCSVSMTGSLQSVWYPYVWSVNSQTLPAGYGNVNRYEITYTSSHNINSYNLIDSWKRDATSNLLGDVTHPSAALPNGNYDLPNDPNVSVVSANSSNAVLKGYTYEILSLDMTTMSTYSTVGWYPFNINNGSQQIKFGYSLHTAIVGVDAKENIDKPFELSVYPNPSDESVTISMSSDKSVRTEISIFDVAGKLISITNKTFSGAESKHIFSTKHLPSGIYFVNLKGEAGFNKTFKQVVSH